MFCSKLLLMFRCFGVISNSLFIYHPFACKQQNNSYDYFIEKIPRSFPPLVSAPRSISPSVPASTNGSILSHAIQI